MTQLSVLLERVHDELPSVPESLALRALSDSFKEFCSRTHIWQEPVAEVTLVPGTAVYTLTPGDGVIVAAVKEVRMEGKKLDPSDVLRNRTSGEPREYVQRNADRIELDVPAPAGAPVTVKAALTLELGADTVDVPASIIGEYGEFIADGAKMRLVRQSNQPWHNPQASITYAGQFYTAVTAAKRRTSSALGEAEMRVQHRSW